MSSLFRSCLDSLVVETLRVQLLTLLGDTFSQQAMPCDLSNRDITKQCSRHAVVWVSRKQGLRGGAAWIISSGASIRGEGETWEARGFEWGHLIKLTIVKHYSRFFPKMPYFYKLCLEVHHGNMSPLPGLPSQAPHRLLRVLGTVY